MTSSLQQSNLYLKQYLLPHRKTGTRKVLGQDTVSNKDFLIV